MSPVPDRRGELLGVKRVGAHHHVTLVAPGVAQRYRPGTCVAVTVGGPASALLVRRSLPIHRVRPTGAHGGTVELVVDLQARPDPGLRWLVAAPPGTGLDVLGPFGRPFALPVEPVTCVLVGDGALAAPLFGLAERLGARGCGVHMLLGGATGDHVLGALEARRSTRGVTVATTDGSVGAAAGVADVLPGLLQRTAAEVVYASAHSRVLHRVATIAERHGAWSQTLLDLPMPCGTGLCGGCTLAAVGEDGVTRMVRACTEGPVLRGDRVRWDDLGRVPEGAR